MRKDIVIPEVKDVYLAAVREFNSDFNTYDWNAYLINTGEQTLETVIIVSEGYDDKDRTSLMRRSIKELPPLSYAKIEFLEDSVLRVANYFSVTYFIDQTLYDKRFEFPSNSILEDNAVALPLMGIEGVLAR
jgi:hypothetical protein